MFVPSANRIAAAAARLARPYADMVGLGVLLARDSWRERDRARLSRPGHRPAAAFAAVMVAGAAVWPGAPALLHEPPIADASPIVASLVETAPASRGQAGARPPMVQQPPGIADPPQFDSAGFAEERLRQLEARLDKSESERRRLASDFHKLQSDVASRKNELSDRERALTDLVAGHSAALGRIAEQASASIEALSKLIARTGIDPARLIDIVRREDGLGGPFVQFAENHFVATDVVAGPLAGPMIRLEALRRALTALPLEAPLVDFAIASHFGVRRDPFTGQAAMHAGLDLRAPLRTAVLSTAPGTVAFAGWQGEYGNMVEIDHGFGIRTRYAHLLRVDVKVGDAIGTRVQLGLLGSTGRSTGPHLHYEVLFEGEALDPIRFIEAKQHVIRGHRRAVRG
jgi:murein DD-endopeptidase MepM/ murein hydrolase activator NlpD